MRVAKSKAEDGNTNRTLSGLFLGCVPKMIVITQRPGCPSELGIKEINCLSLSLRR